MFSDVVRAALEREVAGQSRAVNGVVRGITRVVSGVTPRERSWCAYLFIGPTGTGKSHLVQSLARVLHGHERRVVVADCTSFQHGDPWMALVTQLAPLFSLPGTDSRWAVLEAPPLSIIQIEYLERGPAELSKALAAALESGYLVLPEGRRGSLRNCLVFVTSGLCSREILDEPTPIGFHGALEDEEEDEEQDRVHKTCREQVEKQFGSGLTGSLDGLIVFHRIEEEHLGQILDRLATRLDQWLLFRGFHCRLLPEARAFLLRRGSRDLRLGARELVRAHRRFVEFPLGDMLVSGRIPAGGLVLIDRKPDEEHLHFTVTRGPADASDVGPPGLREVPISWEEGPVLH